MFDLYMDILRQCLTFENDLAKRPLPLSLWVETNHVKVTQYLWERFEHLTYKSGSILI